MVRAPCFTDGLRALVQVASRFYLVNRVKINERGKYLKYVCNFSETGLRTLGSWYMVTG